MKSMLCLFVAAFCGGTLAPAGAPGSSGSPEPLRWNVTLRDGSFLVGVPEVECLELAGTLVSLARIAPEEIVSLRLDANMETVTVRGSGGDRVTGAILNEALVLETGLGRFEVPFDEVRSIECGDALPDSGLEPPRRTRVEGFEPGDVLVDFETDPAGRRLAPGTDLSGTYVPWGLRIATSVETSFPAVDGYVVSSGSQGFSCATQAPRWTGTLTLTFCEPGRPDRPATIQRLGLWVAAVAPGGTLLRALDDQGRVLAERATTQSGSEFLVVESTAPITAVQVIPDPNIDPNYTIDDVVFDSPRAPRAPGDRKSGSGYTVTFTTGDVLRARSIDLEGADLILSGLAIQSDRLRLEKDKVVTILFPVTST